MRFDESCCGVFQKLESIVSACKEIQNSKKLQKCISLILALGNFMNNSTPTEGFDLMFLAKLGDTKSQNEKTTFLHYLAQNLDRENIGNVSSELLSVESAVSANLDATKQELNALISGLKLILKESQFAEEAESISPFAEKMREFYSAASGVVLKCKDLEKSVDLVFGEISTLYALPKSANSGELISVMNSFLLGLEKCRKDNLRDIKMKEMAEKRAKNRRMMKNKNIRQNASKIPIQKSKRICNSIFSF